jgi:DNA-binding IclR family transcriptional regulator
VGPTLRTASPYTRSSVPRPAPQINRVVAVINLLSDRVGGATLTEMAGELGESSSTMVHVLAALTTAGFLVREQSDRRYHLGPALVEPGRVAAGRYPGLAIARLHMDQLSRTFGSACYAFVRDRRWARLVHYTWDPRHPVPPMKIGELIPMLPPLGSVFIAWAPKEKVDEWLGADPSLSDARGEALRTTLIRMRRLGYSVEVRRDGAMGDEVLDQLQRPPSPARDQELRRMLSGDEHLVTEIEEHSSYRVTGIGAPVFGPSGAVDLSITLAPVGRVLSGGEVATMGRRVRSTADAVTDELGGHEPEAQLIPPL